MANSKVIFGAMIAIVLLGLYAYSLLVAVGVALCAPAKDQICGTFGPGLGHTLTTVGGLVSALVIAELAISKPGDPPAVRVLSAGGPNASPPSASSIRAVSWIGSIYVLVWVLLGLAAYVVGAMLHPDKVQALTDFGQAWLGLAVAAGYAFFGVNRQ